MIKVYSRQVGFTLIEMAVVLVIVGLVIGSGFSMVGPYLDNAKQSHTKGNLETTKVALLNYVKVNRHMPCPDGDGSGDGKADSTGSQCDFQFGTIPFDDLGVAQATVSDDWGNLFGYGIHAKAIDNAIMGLDITDDTDAETLKESPGSYFYRTRAPAFDLDTPPTVVDPDEGADSFTICKRTADDCADADSNGLVDNPSYAELTYIPAVVVALNQNGAVTDLTDCAGSRGAREAENCDADMQLIKGVFREGLYDDQIATISAYEIKQQVLDLLNSISTGNVADWDSYTHIINKEFAGTNELNSADGGNNEFLVTGNIANNGTIGLQGGDDILAVLGYLDASIINGGNGDDLLLVTRDDYADLAALTALMTAQGNHNIEYVCYYFDLDECYSVVEGGGGSDDILTVVADPNSGTIDDLLDRVR